MKQTEIHTNVEQYLDEISKENIDKTYYLEKIKKYSNECGCFLSAIFLIAAIIAFSFYIFLVLDWSQLSILKLSLSGLAFMLLSAFAGKVIGVGLARIKLKLLCNVSIHKSSQP